MAATNGKAILAGVIGFPISHSLSPALHEFWLKQYAINGAYVPLNVAPEQFRHTISVLASIGFRGFNITLPHKETAWTLVDTRDEAASIIGAVNTIVVRDGCLHGSNTDAYGYIEHLKTSAHTTLASHPLSQRHALIIGAGGAARAVCAGLIMAGCDRITITNRDKNRAQQLLRDIQHHFPKRSLHLSLVDWENKQAAVNSDITLLVNTTQLGMHGQPTLDIDLQHLPTTAIVSDIVYRPLETALLAQGNALGLVCVDGIGMLLWQAQAGFEQWFGVKPEVSPQLRDYMLSLTD
jgi:shikimate dehydrogenase